MLPTDVLALTVGEKSPPVVCQVAVLKNRWVQVASPELALAPPPSLPNAWDVPSPQSASSRCSFTVSAPAWLLDMLRVSVAPVMGAPAGTWLARSKAITARRALPLLFLPAKMWLPAPLLNPPVMLK